MRSTLMAKVLLLACVPYSIVACAETETSVEAKEASTTPPTVTEVTGDPFRGKQRFVDQGCVICHSVRGVGGRLAPPLDAREYPHEADPMSFAARMWRGATIMAELQRAEIGYQVDLTGQDLSDLAAFAASEEAQETFVIGDVPATLQDLFINEISLETDLSDRYQGEEWYDFGERQ